MIKDRQLKLDDFYYMDLKTSVKTNFYFMFMMNQMETRFSQSKRFRLYLRNRLSLRPVPICKTNGRTSPFCTFKAHHCSINPDGDIKENRCRIFFIHPVIIIIQITLHFVGVIHQIYSFYAFIKELEYRHVSRSAGNAGKQVKAGKTGNFIQVSYLQANTGK